jgi:hypothetical protein
VNVATMLSNELLRRQSMVCICRVERMQVTSALAMFVYMPKNLEGFLDVMFNVDYSASRNVPQLYWLSPLRMLQPLRSAYAFTAFSMKCACRDIDQVMALYA